MPRALNASIRHKGTMDSGAGGRPAGGLYGYVVASVRRQLTRSMFGAAAQAAPMGSGALDQGATSGGGVHAGGASRTLDLVFIMDATGSMGSYIAEQSATKNIEMISEEIVRSEFLAEPGALRVGLISYRDHPPQDHVYIVRNLGFTTDINHMKENLNSLFAAGGGDGPEAVTAALKAATELDWRPDAAKMAILIADAPPHGIGEYGDGFPNGSPDGEDPIVLARRMASMGISLFMVACEPALSGYQHAVDFYQGIVQVTSGMLVPLTTASLLSHVVVAAAGEVMDLDRLHREVGDAVLDRLRSLSLGASEGAEAPPAPGASSHLMDQVAMELHERLMLRNENTKQLIIESIYRESEESRHNVEVWANAADLFSARPYIRKFVGSRLSEKFLEMRRSGLSARPGSSDTGGIGYRFESPSAPVHHTPSRQIVRDFSPFQARPGTTLYSGVDRESSGSPARFIGYRAGDYRSAQPEMMDDDDDDDGMRNDAVPAPACAPAAEVSIAGDNGQQLSYRQDTISLDQARRLAHQSLARRVL